MSQELFLNGLDADTGGYLTEGMTTEKIAMVARGQTLDPDDLNDIDKRKSYDFFRKDHMGVAPDTDPGKLEEAGWSIIFPADLPQKSLDAIKEALKPLLDLRKAQAASISEIRYKEVSGEDGYKNGESKNDFLKRFGRGPGEANPDKFPYYAMIVGSPETIPYSFQYQLDVQYAVGRIYFDRLEDYYNYATSVVQVETRKLARARKAVFFGTANADDRATQISSANLINPLYTNMKAGSTGWEIDLMAPEQANKSNLAGYLGGDKTPALLFTASHGINFKLGDPRQMRHQGALVTAEWPGPKARVPITDEFYFSMDDLPSDADVFGMIAFFFACYGGGTPKMDSFSKQAFDTPRQIAPYSFLSALPTKLLSHPKGGALGVFAHVERAWGASFMVDGALADVTTFNSAIDALSKGDTVGMATEFFNERYAEISSDLTTQLEETTPETENDVKIAGLWTSNNDARNYAFLGDPAVRLAVAPVETPKVEGEETPKAEREETPKAEREKLGAIVTKYPAGVKAAAAGFQPDVVERAPVATGAATFGVQTGVGERASVAKGAATLGVQTDVVEDAPVAKAAKRNSSPTAEAAAEASESAPGGPTTPFGFFSKGGEGSEGAAPSATSQALRDFVDKVGKYMSQALDDATSLEISTYTSPDLTQVAYEGGKFTGGAALRAMTRIAIDGDTLVCVPTDEDGEVDAAVWQIHLDMVQQAQASRAELIRTVASAAASIANVVK